MSQTGYLLAAFAWVVVVIVGWLALMAVKFARLRREATELGEHGAGERG